MARHHKAIKDARAVARKKRHYRIRKTVIGSALCPRLSYHRSCSQFYVQLIDDHAARTLVGMASGKKLGRGVNIAKAKAFGALVAEQAILKGISQVVFDRAGYRYHGRVKALSLAAKEKGLKH